MATVRQFPCLNDNYGYLIASDKAVIAIDVPDGTAYVNELQKLGWGPVTHCLITHWHHDHSGGVPELLKLNPNMHLVGGEAEKDSLLRRCPFIPAEAWSRWVVEGDEIQINDEMKFNVLDVPGHTNGHVAFVEPLKKWSFVGDALFSMGCGRMFEGKPKQFWESLDKLRNLPDDTLVWCAHEYTEANAKFALSVDPDNEDLQAYAQEVKQKRERQESTVPTTMGFEKKINPFIRPEALGPLLECPEAENFEIFRTIRKKKDNF